MKRILIVVAVLTLLSVVIVSLASAATSYVLAPSQAARLQPASTQATASTGTLVNLVPVLDRGRADPVSHVDGPERANENCPFHSSSSTINSNPSY